MLACTCACSGVALPLTIVLGTLLAIALAGGSVWLALLVGAALARPTPHWARA
jgi:hypothetical protein